MSAWLRYVALIALPLAVPSLAHAQSNADQAAQLNDEGKSLWQEKNDLAGAVEKFRQATELDPDPRYYFNLCYSLHQLGRFREAQSACTEVVSRGDAKQQQKAQVVLDDVEQKLAQMPPDTNTGTNAGGDPGDGSVTTDPGATTGSPTGTGDPASMGGQPGPVPGLYQPAVLPDDYKWSLGVEVGLGISSLGSRDVVRRSAGQIKFLANFMLLPAQRIGAQGYFTLTSRPPAEFGESLSVGDFGGALYKHMPRGRYYLTPLVGAHLSVIGPTNSSGDGVGTLGLHGEVGFSALFGLDRRHVISVTPGISLYFPASGDLAAFYGLDKNSIAITVNVGYSLRFTTPFGQSTIITLE